MMLSTPRREMIKSVMRGAAVLCGATILGGCSSPATKRLVDITIAVVGGNGFLRPFLPYLGAALATARGQVGGIRRITVITDPNPDAWFPLPHNVFTPQPIVDNPSIEMPDMVLTWHREVRDRLVVRALDLTSRLDAYRPRIQDIPDSLIRQGMTIDVTRGSIQASLPVLREPLLCAVGPGNSSKRSTEVWDANTFTSTLRGLQNRFTSPNAPIPFIPYGSGVLPMAAVGSGGYLGICGNGSCQGAIVDNVFDGISVALGWTQYCTSASVRSPGVIQMRSGSPEGPPIYNVGDLKFGVQMLDGSLILQRNGPTPVTLRGFPNPKGWSICVVPRFPTRLAVPTNNLDIMVARHSAVADRAIELAVELLGQKAQADFFGYRAALVLRSEQALQQLKVLHPNSQTPEIIATSRWDINDEDAWNAVSKGNAHAVHGAEQRLSTAVAAITGARGGYSQASSSHLVLAPTDMARKVQEAVAGTGSHA